MQSRLATCLATCLVGFLMLTRIAAQEQFIDVPKYHPVSPSPTNKVPTIGFMDGFSPAFAQALLGGVTNRLAVGGNLTYTIDTNVIYRLLKDPRFAADQKQFREIALQRHLPMDKTMKEALGIQDEFQDVPETTEKFDPMHKANMTPEEKDIKADIQALSQNKEQFRLVILAIMEANDTPEVSTKVKEATALVQDFIAKKHPEVYTNYLRYIHLQQKVSGKTQINMVR